MTKILDHGELSLVKVCASDLDVVNAAKVSFNATVSEMDDHCKGLIRYLVKNKHGTPFEHNYFQFRVKAPIFVFREWHRHRVGHSYNEWSARYSKLEPEFYLPSKLTTQVGKPGRYTFEDIEDDNGLKQWMLESYRSSYIDYENLLDEGVSKQQARSVLPVATYSEMIWSCNARSLMNFLALRNSDQAQFEIREYAIAAEKFFEEAMPITYSAFVDNNRVSP